MSERGREAPSSHHRVKILAGAVGQAIRARRGEPPDETLVEVPDVDEHGIWVFQSLVEVCRGKMGAAHVERCIFGVKAVRNDLLYREHLGWFGGELIGGRCYKKCRIESK